MADECQFCGYNDHPSNGLFAQEVLEELKPCQGTTSLESKDKGSDLPLQPCDSLGEGQ